ncbi:MAG: hypothetical protein ABIO24_02465, partial [Saprospiraceae bacterium]
QAARDWSGWPENWLSTLLSASYYLLFVSPQDPTALSRAIQFAEVAEKYSVDSLPGYRDAALLKTNHAHALILRDGTGDRDKAITLYRDFIGFHDLPNSSYLEKNHWELLQKDFRDLHAAKVQLPRLRELIQEIKPADVQISPEDWRDMGGSAIKE